jgi:integrase
MAAALEKTKTPGIYKRGDRYAVIFRDADGKQRQRSARTLDEARKLKAARTADVARGEFHEQSQESFADYATAWVERYHGTGRRGFRESTRDDYRRLLRDAAIPFLGRKRLTQITPKDVADYIGWLCDSRAQARHAHDLAVTRARDKGEPEPKPLKPDARRELSDSTVRNMVNPVRSCLASAKDEGLIRHNPTTEARLPHRERIDDDDDDRPRPFSLDQLDAVLRVVHPRHRLMFRLLAETGLRVSELIALQWRHLRLDGSEPAVRVRRAIVRGRVQPPKSRYGKRDVALDAALVSALRERRQGAADDDLVFPSLTGTPLNPENVRSRVLAPAAEEADAAWAGFHTFRHTCASRLFDCGANVIEVQKWLGHHAASFTLDTYIDLMPDRRRTEPLNLAAELEATEASKGSASAEGTPGVVSLST